ncbi:MAG: ABC transporter permease [Gaiellaceae bacterium]
MRTLRLLVVGYVLQMKILTRSAFNGILSVVWPMFFATTAFFIFRAGHDPHTLLYASLGASVMGVWSATSTAASGAIQQQRWQGLLEILVAAPTHFALVLLPLTVAMSSIGLYSMIATLAWGHFAFGIAIQVTHPLLFVLAVPTTIAAIGAAGFLLSVSVVRYRTAWALGNALEYPVWLVCGFLVPLSVLPAWVHPVAWALAPTWGVRAIREAALGGGAPATDLLVCAAIGVVYVVVGVALVETVLRAARRTATLSLT